MSSKSTPSTDGNRDENKHDSSSSIPKKSFAVTSRRSNSQSNKSHKKERNQPSKPLANLLDDDIPKALQQLTGEHFRRSRCGPEFLERLSKEPSIASGNDPQLALSSQVKVLTGHEAVSVYRAFLKEFDATQPFNLDTPLVFASIALHAGRKCVDYYLSWRGKLRANELKDRDADFLDSEFKRLSRQLDKEYKKSLSPPASTSKAHSTLALTPSDTSIKQDQDQPASEQPTKSAGPNADEPPTRPALSSKASVMSLPILNMVRGVPFGNRTQLRVTNPDLESDASPTPRTSRIFSQIRNSIIGGNMDPSPLRAVNRLETLAEEPTADEPASRGSAQQQANPDSPPTAASQPSNPPPAVPSPADGEIRSSSAITSSSSSNREFVIVVLDESYHKHRSHSWHGMERRVSTKAPPQRSKSTPQDVSPWVGPLVSSDGTSFSTPPSTPRAHGPPSPASVRGARWAALNPRKRNQPLQVTPSLQRSESDSESSTEEEPWMTSPVIPIVPSVASTYGPIVPIDLNQMQAYGLTPLAPPVIPIHKNGLPTPINSPFPVQPPLPNSVPVLSASMSPLQAPVNPASSIAFTYTSPVRSHSALPNDNQSTAQQHYDASAYRPAVFASPPARNQVFPGSPYSTLTPIPLANPYVGSTTRQPYMDGVAYPGTPYQMMDRPVMG